MSKGSPKPGHSTAPTIPTMQQIRLAAFPHKEVGLRSSATMDYNLPIRTDSNYMLLILYRWERTDVTYV